MSQPYSTFTAKRKPIPAFSAKRLASLDEHKAFIARILEERPDCQGYDIVTGAFFRADLDANDHSAMTRLLRSCKRHSNVVHHVLQRSLCGTDDDDNVLALCQWGCHRWIDDHIELAHKLGLLRRSYDSPPIPSQVADNGAAAGSETAQVLPAVVPDTGTPAAPTFCSRCEKDATDVVGLSIEGEEHGFCSVACLCVYVMQRWMVSQ